MMSYKSTDEKDQELEKKFNLLFDKTQFDEYEKFMTSLRCSVESNFLYSSVAFIPGLVSAAILLAERCQKLEEKTEAQENENKKLEKKIDELNESLTKLSSELEDKISRVENDCGRIEERLYNSEY